MNRTYSYEKSHTGRHVNTYHLRIESHILNLHIEFFLKFPGAIKVLAPPRNTTIGTEITWCINL